MQNRATQHQVGKGIRKGHVLDGFDSEVARWHSRTGQFAETPERRDGPRIGVSAEDIVSLLAGHAEKIGQVAAVTAARVENSHAGLDAAPQELVEKVDIDLAKLLDESVHGLGSPDRMTIVLADCLVGGDQLGALVGLRVRHNQPVKGIVRPSQTDCGNDDRGKRKRADGDAKGSAKFGKDGRGRITYAAALEQIFELEINHWGD